MPKFFLNEESGKLAISMTLGDFVIDRDLPDYLATYDQAALHAYFRDVVDDMMYELAAHHQKETRKLKKRAKKLI